MIPSGLIISPNGKQRTAQEIRTDVLSRSPGGFTTKAALKVLELYDGKLSRTVLRGERERKLPDLPGAKI